MSPQKHNISCVSSAIVSSAIVSSAIYGRKKQLLL